MSLARETGREEKASMFHDTRESLCVQKVSMFRDVRESLCVTWSCAFRKGMGAQLRVERLKAERVRQSLSVTMAVSCVGKREASGWGLKLLQLQNYVRRGKRPLILRW